MIYLDYLLLSFKTDKEIPIGPSEIAGLISQEYNRYFSRLHTAPEVPPEPPGSSGASSAYFYPRLQYKIVRHGPMIAAVNEGCQLLWDLYEKLDDIPDTDGGWRITEKRLIDKKAPFGISKDFKKYRFLTPWLAMPEGKFKKYLTTDRERRDHMLAGFLEDHFRSAAQSLGCEIRDEVRIKFSVKANYIFHRDIHVVGLFGSFWANFEFPSFLGLGNSVSRGFGTVKQM